VSDPITYFDRYDRTLKTERIYGERWLRWAYEQPVGRFAVWLLIRRAFFSRWYGARMNKRYSDLRILSFIAEYDVDVREFVKSPFDYKTFNEFFYRALKPEARPIAPGAEVAVLPADGRHLAFPDVEAADGFYVKGVKFTLAELLGEGGAAAQAKPIHAAPVSASEDGAVSVPPPSAANATAEPMADPVSASEGPGTAASQTKPDQTNAGHAQATTSPGEASVPPAPPSPPIPTPFPAGLAQKFAGGSMLISRLCPSDYHRFHFPVSGTPSETWLLNGWLYSVSPIALRRNLGYLVENKRMLTLIESPEFGTVAQIEVGATNVGTIRQFFEAGRPVQKGEEKGLFAFGGSCVITLFERGRIAFDPDLVASSGRQIEVYARMGDRLGVATR
jgi:phosphatidylserine decarboxylase precursor